MALNDYIRSDFEEFYTNPYVVLAAFFLIIFAVSLSALKRIRLWKNNPSIPVVVSLVIGIYFAYYFRNEVMHIAIFNLLLYATVILVFLYLGWKLIRRK